MEQYRAYYHQKIKEHLRSAYLLSEEKIEAVLPRFLATVRTLLAELEDLAGTDKHDELSRTGHAMKGALLNLGLHDLAAKAFNIEKHQETKDVERDCVQLVNELKQEVEKIF